jgi:hypothetical protein
MATAEVPGSSNRCSREERRYVGQQSGRDSMFRHKGEQFGTCLGSTLCIALPSREWCHGSIAGVRGGAGSGKLRICEGRRWRVQAKKQRGQDLLLPGTGEGQQRGCNETHEVRWDWILQASHVCLVSSRAFS